MELNDTMIVQTVLIVTLMTTVLGLIMSAKVIFEASADFKRNGIPKDKVQDIKKRDVMPRLWAPMYAGIFAEVLLVVMTLAIPMDATSRVILGAAAVLFAVVIVMLARYFSRAGRS
jgi:hypothetical protein